MWLFQYNFKFTQDKISLNCIFGMPKDPNRLRVPNSLKSKTHRNREQRMQFVKVQLRLSLEQVI